MFANVGEYEACGLFSLGHFILLIISIISIRIALHYTYNISKEKVYMIIRRLAVILSVLEILRITYTLTQYDLYNVNTYLPLYFCSLLLFSTILSGYCKGKLKRAGDVFIATGAIVGGTVFLLMPTTSLPTFPAFHFISIHSFLYHSIMIYLGILVNITEYVKINKFDIVYYSSLVGSLCVIALFINNIFDSNLMFISQNFPNTPIEIIYNITGGGVIFKLVMSVAQMTLPFYGIEYIKKIYNDLGLLDKFKEKEESYAHIR